MPFLSVIPFADFGGSGSAGSGVSSGCSGSAVLSGVSVASGSAVGAGLSSGSVTSGFSSGYSVCAAASVMVIGIPETGVLSALCKTVTVMRLAKSSTLIFSGSSTEIFSAV